MDIGEEAGLDTTEMVGLDGSACFTTSDVQDSLAGPDRRVKYLWNRLSLPSGEILSIPYLSLIIPTTTTSFRLNSSDVTDVSKIR